MLSENDIVEKVCTFLKSENYTIIQSLGTNEKGIDIIAEKKGETLYIEAKGETSSKSYTNRFGKPFDKKQIYSHVSRAILTSMKILAKKPSGKETVSAIALPKTTEHKILIDEIKSVLEELKISIFWVTESNVKRE